MAMRLSVLVTAVYSRHPGLWDLVYLGVSRMGQWVEVGEGAGLERRTLFRL